MQGGLCPGGLCPGGLFPGISVQGGLCLGRVSGWGVSVQGSLRGVSVQGGLCQGDPLPYGNVRAARILLECILVGKKFTLNDTV